MANGIEPITEETEAAEVEAHGSVLNLQGLGMEVDTTGTCFSVASNVNER
jgi:hypothetical protein